MKTRILILTFLIILSHLCYSQKKGLLTELSLNTSLFSRTKNVDAYMRNMYADYTTSFIVSGGIGAAIGYNFTDKFGAFIDCSMNSGGDYENYGKKQYKKLDSYTTALSMEYNFLKKEKNSFSAKIGIGYDNTTFFYSRKEPIDIVSLSYTNVFVPIALTWWNDISNNNMLGISLQYNAVVAKGNASITGIDYKLNTTIPNISLNNLSVSMRVRF